MQFAKTHDPAYFGALNYRDIPGFTVGGALFTSNSTQGNADFKADNTQPDLAGMRGRVTLGDVHTRWQQNGWDLQALYAKGKFSEADKIDATLLAFNTSNSAGRPYTQASSTVGWYKVLTLFGSMVI